MENISTALQRRINGFSEIEKRAEYVGKSLLLLEHKIDLELFAELRKAATNYIYKCLPQSMIDPIQGLDKYKEKIPNITPNGMIVCKRHTVLEYNILVQRFINIIKSLGIDDLIESWHIPLNLRVKYGERDEANMQRHHPTEHIHSDSWAGESIRSVTTHIPILGDTENNGLKFYEPPNDFQDEWLGPLSSYADGSHIAERYSESDLYSKTGHIYLQDFGGLHSTHRNEGAGTRVTIDTTFILKRPEDIPELEHKFRSEERASHKFLSNIGAKTLLHFPDTAKDIVDCQGGFKHASNAVKLTF